MKGNGLIPPQQHTNSFKGDVLIIMNYPQCEGAKALEAKREVPSRLLPGCLKARQLESGSKYRLPLS